MMTMQKCKIQSVLWKTHWPRWEHGTGAKRLHRDRNQVWDSEEGELLPTLEKRGKDDTGAGTKAKIYER